MKYLDFHQHYGAFVSVLKIKERAYLKNIDDDQFYEKELIQKCKKLDMVVAVNGCGFKGMVQLINKNDEVEKLFKKNPDYLIGMGYVDLDYDNPNYIDNLYKRGFKAIKVIWPNERYDSEKYFEIYKRCEYYNLPILFHTGTCAIHGFNRKKRGCSFNMAPFFLEMIGINFPDLKIVGAHLGVEWAESACTISNISTLARKNVIKFDIALADGYRERIIEGNYIKRSIPVDNVLYGHDEPPSRYEEIISQWDDYFDKIKLTEEERDKIFFKNACNLLNIEY